MFLSISGRNFKAHSALVFFSFPTESIVKLLLTLMATKFGKYHKSLTQVKQLRSLSNLQSWVSRLKAARDSSCCSTFLIHGQHHLGSSDSVCLCAANRRGQGLQKSNCLPEPSCLHKALSPSYTV